MAILLTKNNVDSSNENKMVDVSHEPGNSIEDNSIDSIDIIEDNSIDSIDTIEDNSIEYNSSTVGRRR